MKASNFLAFLGGALVGGILALLFAPEKGETTRQKIKEKLDEKGIHLSAEELDKFIEKLKEELNLKKEQKPTSSENDLE